MNIICGRCKSEYETDEIRRTSFAGRECTVGEYMELVKGNSNIDFWCEKCIEETPNIDHLFESGNYFVSLKNKNINLN